MGASQEFDDAFAYCGGSSIECSCGILYFDNYNDYAWDWEEGERESLEKAAGEPDSKVVALEGAVESIEIEGCTYVTSCDCKPLSRYENFIWTHRRQIQRYLELRSEAEFKQAEADLAIADATRKNLKIARLFLGDPNDYSDLEAQGIDWRSQIK